MSLPFVILWFGRRALVKKRDTSQYTFSPGSSRQWPALWVRPHGHLLKVVQTLPAEDHEACSVPIPGHPKACLERSDVRDARDTSVFTHAMYGWHWILTFFPMKSVVGSCRNVSRMVIRASSFCRRRYRLISQVLRNGPLSRENKYVRIFH